MVPNLATIGKTKRLVIEFVNGRPAVKVEGPIDALDFAAAAFTLEHMGHTLAFQAEAMAQAEAAAVAGALGSKGKLT